MNIKKLVIASALSLSSIAVAMPISSAAAAPAVAVAEAPAAVGAPAAAGAGIVAARYNGCTGVPDSGPSFNFTAACNWHDWCYSTHPYGGGYSGRLACDNGFSSRMVSWCTSHHAWYNPARYTCTTVAQKYYQGVRLLGGSHF